MSPASGICRRFVTAAAGLALIIGPVLAGWSMWLATTTVLLGVSIALGIARRWRRQWESAEREGERLRFATRAARVGTRGGVGALVENTVLVVEPKIVDVELETVRAAAPRQLRCPREA